MKLTPPPPQVTRGRALESCLVMSALSEDADKDLTRTHDFRKRSIRRNRENEAQTRK